MNRFESPGCQILAVSDQSSCLSPFLQPLYGYEFWRYNAFQEQDEFVNSVK